MTDVISRASVRADAGILVLDHDVRTRSRTVEILERAGYSVQSSSTGFLSPADDAPLPSLIVFGSGLDQEPKREQLAGVPRLRLGNDTSNSADVSLPENVDPAELLRVVELLLALHAEGVLRPELEVVDVGAVLELSLALTAAVLEPRATVIREFDRQLRVHASPTQLCLIFCNLLRTAAARIAPGTPATNGVRVAAWRTAEGRTIVEISDTGARIQPKQLAHIFDASAHSVDSRPSDMGFAESERIVARDGGSITVASSASGTRFRVELPTA